MDKLYSLYDAYIGANLWAIGISLTGAILAIRILEAYSWGVGEDESGDGLYCGFEGVVGAAVIGV